MAHRERRRWQGLACASALALAAAPVGAETFSYSGKVVDWTVPQTGVWAFALWGGAGGGGIQGIGPAAPGAEAGGDIDLSAGTVLTIVVAGDGRTVFNAGGGGGGASWLIDGGDLIAVAGGGGGQFWAGGGGYAATGAAVPGSGAGGMGTPSLSASPVGGGGGGGAGWLGAGGGAPLGRHASGYGGYGAPTFAGGGVTPPPSYCPSGFECYAGGVGGFGGGGGGGYDQGGGGAGFTGGSAGGAMTAAGGGTSYLAPAVTDGFSFGGVSTAGLVELNLIAAPEPSTWLLAVGGAGAVGGALRRRRDKG